MKTRKIKAGYYEVKVGNRTIRVKKHSHDYSSKFVWTAWEMYKGDWDTIVSRKSKKDLMDIISKF